MLEDIQKRFEDAFDIPFVSQFGLSGNDIWYSIGPKSHAKEYFTLNIRFQNDVRLIMELQPDQYSKPFWEDLGNTTEEKKKTFVEFAKMFEKRKAKISFAINRLPTEWTSYERWPLHWDHVALRVSRSPVSVDQINHEEVILDWGIAMMGMILSLASIIPLENPDPVPGVPQREGNVQKALVNKYERNPVNRALCIAMKGTTCSVCGFDFGKTYGPIGAGFIHVHHGTPLSCMGPDYLVDPEKDLFPVCSNCHAMLHRSDPPMSVESLKQIYTEINAASVP